MITLIIDGQEVQAQEGQTVLEVARENGIEIPTLCYHPFLKPYGACRLCTVEIRQGNRVGLETSCTYPVADGLVVETRSPQVIEARKMLMTMLLFRCPNVPLIQDMAREYGVVEPPFPTDTPDEKCVLCGLCVRVCHEIVGVGAISFANRGVDREVVPPFLEETRDCIGCGACTIVCPTGAIEIADEAKAVYEAKPLGPISAIYVPFLQAVPRVPIIDTDDCIRFRQNDRTDGEISDACGVCQMVCEADAINFDQQDEIIELDVDAIIVATGFDPFDANLKPEMGYAAYPNVITTVEFERLSSAAGPTTGKITLNGQEPKDVVFIHCVGSRDQSVGNPYCSRVCCMAVAKQAHLVREKLPDARITVFYMDMRAFGKGFEEFYDRVREEGVIYRRGNPSEVYKRGDKLVVRAEDTLLGEPVEVEADLVVLAVGMVPRGDAGEVAGLLRLPRSENGFFMEVHPKLRPVDTGVDGVYLAGCCQGPKDIPDAVAQAKAAASPAIAMMSQMRREWNEHHAGRRSPEGQEADE